MRQDKFLKRPVYDHRTRTWSHLDGSGVLPDEMRIDMELASEMRNSMGYNGIYVLGTMFGWKERIKKILRELF